MTPQEAAEQYANQHWGYNYITENNVYHQLSGMLKAGRNVSEIVESLSYKFEIKRKPL